jgi:MFS family permease
MEVIWGVLTLCLSQCNTAHQIYGVRFLVGLAESTFYLGMQYLIGSWYRKDELGKRSCIFHTSSAIATMVSSGVSFGMSHQINDKFSSPDI